MSERRVFYSLPLTPRAQVIVIHRRGEGYIVMTRRWRDGTWWRDLSTQEGPYRTRRDAVDAAEVCAGIRRVA